MNHRILEHQLAAAFTELATAVEDWRNAPCSYPGTNPADDERCDGENHLETCAAELARQNLIATHNRMRAGSSRGLDRLQLSQLEQLDAERAKR